MLLVITQWTTKKNTSVLYFYFKNKKFKLVIDFKAPGYSQKRLQNNRISDQSKLAITR